MPQVWKWTKQKRAVLNDVFLGELSQAKIVQKHRVALGTFLSWIQHPEFRAALAAERANMEQSLFERGVQYVAKEHRITALATMAEAARVQYEAHELLQEKRQIGFDKEHEEPLYLINENFNKDAHAAFRESLNDIAKELGHRTQKVEQHATFDVTQHVSFYMPEPETPPDEEKP